MFGLKIIFHIAQINAYIYCYHSLFRKAFLSGPICGAAAQWVSSPTDLLKVRMQLESRRRLLGLPPRSPRDVSSVFQSTYSIRLTVSLYSLYSRCRHASVWQALRNIVREEGVLGLYRGSIPNVQRAFLVNLGGVASRIHKNIILSILLIIIIV